MPGSPQTAGVSVYNGSVWTNYTSSNSGLANDQVDISPRIQGNMLLATAGGLSKFNGTVWTNFNMFNTDIPQWPALCSGGPFGQYLGIYRIGHPSFTGSAFSWTDLVDRAGNQPGSYHYIWLGKTTHGWELISRGPFKPAHRSHESVRIGDQPLWLKSVPFIPTASKTSGWHRPSSSKWWRRFYCIHQQQQPGCGICQLRVKRPPGKYLDSIDDRRCQVRRISVDGLSFNTILPGFEGSFSY